MSLEEQIAEADITIEEIKELEKSQKKSQRGPGIYKEFFASHLLSLAPALIAAAKRDEKARRKKGV